LQRHGMLNYQCHIHSLYGQACMTSLSCVTCDLQLLVTQHERNKRIFTSEDNMPKKQSTRFTCPIKSFYRFIKSYHPDW